MIYITNSVNNTAKDTSNFIGIIFLIYQIFKMSILNFYKDL